MSITPNMNLSLPTPSVSSGPAWASSLNSAFTLVDSHSHLPGYGVQIPSGAIAIDEDLPFNSYNATLLRSLRLITQASPLALATDLTCVYVSGSDLYYNDASGNQVRITASGAVNVSGSGNITGMGGTTATVVYSPVSSTFAFSSASLTPAFLATGPLILSTNAASQHTATITPPAGLSADYTWTLPTGLPASTFPVTATSSGTLSYISYDAIGQAMSSVGANAIAASMNTTGTNSIINTMGAAGANSISNNRTRSVSQSVGLGGIATSTVSSVGGVFNTTSGVPVLVPGLQVAIITGGRPVSINFAGNTHAVTGGGPGTIGGVNGSISGTFVTEVARDGATLISRTEIYYPATTGFFPCAGFNCTDLTVTAGYHTYQLNVYQVGGGGAIVQVDNVDIVVYEL